MRAMYSIAVIFTLLAVHLAYAQKATVEPSSLAPADDASTVAAATDTETMQKDEPEASPEPTSEPVKASSEPAIAITTTSAPSVPPLEHHSESGQKTDSPAVSTPTTKAGNNATTPDGKMSTTPAPNDNSAAGVTASIACLLVSVLSVIVHHS